MNQVELVFYKRIAIFRFQPYLDVMSIANIRKSTARLRVSSHRLCVETGRWKKPVSTPLIERKCVYCNLLEDEFHFMFECLLYLDLRKQFLPKYFWKRPNMYKLTELFNTVNATLSK